MLLIHENGIIDLNECFREVGQVQIRIVKNEDFQTKEKTFMVKILMEKAGFFHDAEEVTVSTVPTLKEAKEVKKNILTAFAEGKEHFSIL